MQPAIEELVRLGPLPSSVNPDFDMLKQFQTLLTKIDQPILEDYARALVKLFGPDDCFGLSWTLLHIVETTQGWPIHNILIDTDNEWVDRLKKRAMVAD